MIISIKKRFKRNIKKAILNFINVSPYEFIASHHITEQAFKFNINEKEHKIVADNGCPLYETITEIVDYDCYFLNLIKDMDFSKDVCVDIGANIGTFSIIASNFNFSKVYSFEPIKTNYDFLINNIKINNLQDSISTFNVAVSDYTGKANFNFKSSMNVGSHMVGVFRQHVQQAEDHVEEVNCISANELLPLMDNKVIGLLKLDCEGSEYSIVSSIDAKMCNKIKYITMEVHDLDAQHNLNTMITMLELKGFTCIVKPEMFNRKSLNHVLAYNKSLVRELNTK
jgi:FkbM family methyltransferase